MWRMAVFPCLRFSSILYPCFYKMSSMIQNYCWKNLAKDGGVN